jgi:signal transduction histidine kinase
MAAGMLASDATLSESGQRSVRRIRRAAGDMQELTSAFLLLARDSETGLPVEPVSVNEVIEDEFERARVLAEGKPVRSAVRASCRLVVEAPEKVLSVLLGNLLRNAFSYTDAGEVVVDVDPGVVVIRDSGIGIAPEKVGEDSARRGGHGVGLTIVKRLSDRFGWPVTIESQPGVGTRVEVRFPEARIESSGD